MTNTEIILARAADTIIQQDDSLTADEARALDLLVGFNAEQIDLLIKILDGEFSDAN